MFVTHYGNISLDLFSTMSRTTIAQLLFIPKIYDQYLIDLCPFFGTAFNCNSIRACKLTITIIATGFIWMHVLHHSRGPEDLLVHQLNFFKIIIIL